MAFRVKWLVIVLFLFLTLPLGTGAESASNVVRVGWHESPFNITDQFGRKTGYSYEYQRKIAAYTGWKYEYVEGSWPELFQMLKDGEIDLLGDVSYLEERAGSMLFSSLPMGSEAYYLFVAPDNIEISADDYSTLNGRKVGVTRESIQKTLFEDWARAHDVHVDLVEITVSETDALKMLRQGKLDAFITMDIFGGPEVATPICKLGSSDIYFAVNKDRPELLNDLDAALNRIQDENAYYNQQLYEKYLSNGGAKQYLSAGEKAWLSDHNTIRVGYQDDYLAFCAADENGQLTGALKDYLDYASTCLENAHLFFETTAYPSAGAAMEALKAGEIDCMFPANLTDYDGENLEIVMSPPIMRTEMDAVVRAADQKEFIRKNDIRVCVNEGNTNYEMFLVDNFPAWKIAYFPDTPAGLDAIAARKADCVIISNYRYNNISKQCEDLHLTTVYTGVDMDYSFAIREGDTELYSIISKVTNLVPDSTIHAALTYYSTEDVKISFAELIKDNLFIVMTVIAVILLVILILLIRSIRAERKAHEEERMINDLNRRVFVDALTSVRNKGAFVNYVQELQNRLDKGEKIDFAVGVFDCDNLKQINDQNGHDKGDIYIRAASQLICRVFAHSPVFRIGGDEFAVVLQNEDFINREDLIRRFEREKREKCASATNKWDGPRVAMGIAIHDPEFDSSVDDTLHRADKVMYENKRVGKLES